jgi:hypothetical protein
VKTGPYFPLLRHHIRLSGKEFLMVVKIPTKKMEFGAQDEVFVKQLAKDVGCHYSQTNPRTYCLNKFDSAVQGEMGVFAWVHKEEKDYFWVSTRKVWIEAARVDSATGKSTTGVSCIARNTRQADDSVCFDTKGDYNKTVHTLKLVLNKR